jgi:hypothetical protein
VAKPHKLWRALDQCPIGKAVLADWQRLIGDDFESVRSFLVATGTIAGFFPAPDSDSLPWRVVEHGPDDFVAVCPDSGDTITLSRTDVMVYEIDIQKLAKSIVNALELSPTFEPISGITRCWRIGAGRLGSGLHSQVHLVIPEDSSELRRAIESMHGARLDVGIVLIPTRSAITANVESLSAANNIRLIAMEETLTSFHAGGWEKTELGNHFGEYSSVGSEDDVPLSDRARDILVAMLEMNAVDSDSRKSNPEITYKAFGSSAAPNDQKEVFVELKNANHVGVKLGRGGGYWLNATGKLRAERLAGH